MPDSETADHSAQIGSNPDSGLSADEPSAAGETLGAEIRPGWEDYLSAAADELMAENPPGTGWYRTGIMCAITGLLFPLFFGPVAVLLGMAAQGRRHPRAFIPILLGIAVTIYGAVYYVMAVRGNLG